MAAEVRVNQGLLGFMALSLGKRGECRHGHAEPPSCTTGPFTLDTFLSYIPHLSMRRVVPAEVGPLSDID